MSKSCLRRMAYSPMFPRQPHEGLAGDPEAGRFSQSRLSEEIATNRQGEATRNLNRSISSCSFLWQKPRSYSTRRILRQAGGLVL